MFSISAILLLLLLLTSSCLVNAVFFSMTDIRVTIPSDRGKFPAGNHTLATLYAHDNSSTSLRFTMNDTTNAANNEYYLHVDPTAGDVILTERLQHAVAVVAAAAGDLKHLNISPVSITVADSIGGQDRTSIDINVLPLNPLDCDLILNDLCYWTEVKYRIYENIKSKTLIGSLASPYLAALCPEYRISYTLRNNVLAEFELVRPFKQGKAWSLQTTKQLDRDITVLRKPLTTTCIIENPQGSVRSVEKSIRIEILDVDDNPLEAQEPELNVGLSSNVVYKGKLVEHSELIFKDKDSPAVNNYEATILGDNLNVLLVKCKNYENDLIGEPQTAVHCKLQFTRNMQIPNSTYSVTLQLNDTTLVNARNNSNVVSVPIHLHFHNESGYHPATMKKQFNRPLILYPAREVKVFRTAAPLARITQPTLTHSKDAINFSMQVDPLIIKDIFNVTYAEGIVFVHDTVELKKSAEYVRLNISWTRNKRVEFDEIQVRIVEEPVKTCHDMDDSIENWLSCSEFDNPQDCLGREACAISTGGSSSVEKRKGPERCMWRGDAKPGKRNTNIYSTCTPDVATCPDGICDALEDLNYKICPQDCTDKVYFPTSKNKKTGRGIDRASGTCVCDDHGGCSCDIFRKKGRKKLTKTDESPTVNQTTVLVQPNVANLTAGKILGIEIAKCGTTCLLGIVAGSLFLIGAIAMTVVCWRLDRVHKAVRGKFSDESQDLSAPLSDYIDRSIPETIPINFEMTATTALAETALLNTINKFKPDPKWEFPRSQLTIEQTLGEGEFGRVLRAKAVNIAGETGYTTVAVKTLKDGARETELSDLLSEYQLLKEVSHPNVIRLLGVCTIPVGPVYLIIEFAEHGSLRNYLRRSRHLKSEMGGLPTSTGLDESDNHYDQPNVSKVTPKEILSFAWQISKGMAYLSDIKLVHRDLAARNVLVSTDKICKISDFGLTRDIYEDDAYFKRSKGRVPVKWMAPESLSDHIYTIKSDVWSFGILIWELVTLGAAPYPGIAVQNLFDLLRRGYRMERPDNCSSTVYNIMRSCWNIAPEQRPSFQQLSSLWEQMLGDEVQYLDLTNNAIHNRSYFCAPFENNQHDNNINKTNNDSNPLNYLSKSQSFVKCGASSKFGHDDSFMVTEPDSNQNDIKAQGYETPVKRVSVSNDATTPTNECPLQYYTDMAGRKASDQSME